MLWLLEVQAAFCCKYIFSFSLLLCMYMYIFSYFIQRPCLSVDSVSSLGPNSLIFGFSSGASLAHNAGGYYHCQQIFLTKEVDKCDGKMIGAYYQPLQKVLLDAVH